MKIQLFFLLVVLVISSCNLHAQPSIASSVPQSMPSDAPPLPSPQPIPTNIIPPLLLDVTPLIWFAPLPPLAITEGRTFTGSDDFMNLFKADAPWQNAAGHIQVFKLYGEWVAYKATDSQLKQAVEDLKQRSVALAVEAGPLNATSDCGQGVESFAGTEEGLRIAQRIKDAGGTLTFIALDEPYFFAHFYDGPNACHWDIEKIAKDVDTYIQTVKGIFPDLRIGDTEPLAGAANAQAYSDWLDTFKSINGYDLAFLHMDIDWSRPTWTDEVVAILEHGNVVHVPVGIIYTGNVFDKTDEDWISAAGERVKKLELEKNASPVHVIFQSWNDKPDHVLPETTDFTFTNLIDVYFSDKSALGFKREGLGANVALGKSVRVSRQFENNSGSLAVDGDLGTLWSSGGDPTQWIEIDLEAEYKIQEISLTTSQYPEGRTVHRILGKGASGQFVELTKLDGSTRDGQTLVFKPAEPIQNIRFIRVETLLSPSWVAWREIEVIDAGR